MDYILNFDKIDLSQLSSVGGKNASLGELFQKLHPDEILIPDGFATTASAYREFLKQNHLEGKILSLLKEIDTDGFLNLSEIGRSIRALISEGTFPYPLQVQIIAAYHELTERVGTDYSLAVRSSATTEDLGEANFARQQESYLNIKGEDALLKACLRCYVSLFTDRAIKYRTTMGFDYMEVALSIGVQQMIRADKACSGLGSTLESNTDFENVVVLTSAWGLGENVVKGRIEPDEFIIFKPLLEKGELSILSRKLGAKESTLVYMQEDDFGITTRNIATPIALQKQFALNDAEVETLARWVARIEAYYKMPVDIEWAKDGLNGNLYIVQANPIHIRAQETF